MSCLNCTECKYKNFPRLDQYLGGRKTASSYQGGGYSGADVSQGVDVLCIGDIPQAREVYANEVMTGNGRKIIEQALQQVGITPKCSVGYITAVECAVPKQKGKVISKDVLNCRKRLLEKITEINPKSILILGKTSYQVYTGDWNGKVSEKYGRFIEIPENKISAMAVFNPGVIIRSPNDYKPFVQFLQKFKVDLFGEDLYDPGVTQWRVIKEAMPDFIQWLRNGGDHYKEGHLIGADIETTDIDYRTAEFAVLGLSFAKNQCFVIPREKMHCVREIFEIIHEKGWKVVWQHGKYDKKVLWRRGLADININEDTMYRHYLLDETSPHDLGYLTKMYLNAEEYKFKMNQNFKAVTLETYDHFFDALVERVAVDSDLTRQLCLKLEEEMNRPENASLKKIYDEWMIPVANYLARLEQNGVLIDEDYLKEMGKDYEARLEQIMEEIVTEAKYDWDPDAYMADMGAKTAPPTFNPGSPKQMSWMVFKKLKLKPRVRKGLSTDADVLESIENPPPLIQLVLKYRGVKKEYSTYVLGLLKRRDVDGCVRANFNCAGTATGRLSCKEPNLQNLPSYFGVGNVRRACIARPGYIFAEVDYSGAELRWLAVLSGDANLTNIFVNNINLHDETSRLMYGDNFTKQDRMRAKAVNFGIMYGRQAKSFADEFQISLAEGQDLIDKWLNAYPKAKQYLEWCEEQVNTGKYIQSPWGNRRRFGMVSNASIGSLHNEAKNFAIQCASSHMLLWCCVQLERALAMRGVRCINMVHDSVLLEIPADPETVKWATTTMRGLMCAAPKILFNSDVPFTSDIDIGVDWGSVYALDPETMTLETKEGPVDYTTWYEKAKHTEIFETEWFKNLKEVPKVCIAQMPMTKYM